MFNLDIIMFFSFLTLNLVVGLWYSRGVKNLRQYAIGDKQFSTIVIALTIAATYTTGDSFLSRLVYAEGLFGIVLRIRYVLSFLLLGLLYIRAGEFLKYMTIAEAMGSMYGKKVRTITAISAIIISISTIAIQFMVGGIVTSQLLGIDTKIITVIIGCVVIFYSTFGGIKAITFTDVLQFAALGIFFPLLILKIWYHTNATIPVIEKIVQDPHMSASIFTKTGESLIGTIEIISILATPTFIMGLLPTMFQRFQMGKDVYQVKKSFLYATLLTLLITLFIIGISLLLRVENPGLSKEVLLSYLFKEYGTPGFKSLMAIGLMSMMMSTADSFLNSATVLLVNDLMPFSFKKEKEMYVVYITTILIGFISICMALSNYDIMYILNTSRLFYIPILIPPLLLGLFGFRSSQPAVLVGMAVGFFVAILPMSSVVKYLTTDKKLLLGTIANVISLVASHYLLGEKSWGYIKQPEPLILQRKVRKVWWQNLWESLYSKSLQERLLLNLPTKQEHYFFIGLYAFLTNFLAVFGLSSDIFEGIFFQSILYTLFLATSLIMTYPAWPPFIKNRKLVAWAYPLLLCYTFFVVTPIITVLVDFKPLYLGLLIVHVIVTMSLLHGWMVILIALLGSVVSAILLISIGMPLLPTYFSWQIGILFGVILLLMLFAIVAKNKSIMQKLFIQNHYVKHSNKLLHDNMLKLKSSEMRFLRHCKYNGLNKVHAVSENIIKEMQADRVGDKHISKVSELSYQIKTNAGHLDQMIGYMENRLNIYRRRIVIIKLLQTIKKRYIAMQNSIKLLIQNKCKKDYFSGDIEKVEEMLAFLINKVADIGKTSYVFITVEPTNLVYTHAIAPYKAIAFYITTSATELTIKQEYRHEDRPTTLSVINTLVDQHYGYLDDLGDGNYVLVLPQNIKSICPSNKEETPRKIANWVLVHAQRVEGYFWAKLLRKECANGYNISRIRLALSIMKAQHGDHPRKSKHLFYTHSIHVAIGVMDCTDDESLIIASLLHDRTEDANMNTEEIEPIFGKRVGEITTLLINQKSKFKKYKQIQKKDKVLELSLAGDPDAILIKLHDRRHNICTLSAKESHKRRAKAIQTLDYYVPLARKLGFNSMANSLEELCKLYLVEEKK